jgi:hypothetical protein
VDAKPATPLKGLELAALLLCVAFDTLVHSAGHTSGQLSCFSNNAIVDRARGCLTVATVLLMLFTDVRLCGSH